MLTSTPIAPKKFLTNQGENTLSKRLEKILPLTQDFDCLVGYFFISGFFRLYPALEAGQESPHPHWSEKRAGRPWPDSDCHNGSRGKCPIHRRSQTNLRRHDAQGAVQAQDSLAIETGVRKFIEWIRSGKLEVKLTVSRTFTRKFTS